MVPGSGAVPRQLNLGAQQHSLQRVSQGRIVRDRNLRDEPGKTGKTGTWIAAEQIALHGCERGENGLSVPARGAIAWRLLGAVLQGEQGR